MTDDDDVNEIKQPAMVSIGMPVYNGERFVSGALDSLLAQDFVDFEIVISDNASTDRTPEICLQYVRSDPRIKYVRNDENIGASANFNRVFELTCGELFMWAAHDDEWAPSYIKECVELLRQHPSAVLASSEIEYIDEKGQPVAAGFESRIDTIGLNVGQRLHEVVRRYGWFDIYGVVRREALANTHLYRNKLGGDVLLTFELLLGGDFVIAPERLFRYRLPVRRKSVGELFQSITAENGTRTDRTPHLTMARDLLGIVSESELAPQQQEDVRSDFIATLGFENKGWRRKILHEQGLPSRWPYSKAAVDGIFSELLSDTHDHDSSGCAAVRKHGGLPMKAAFVVERALLRLVLMVSGAVRAAGLSRDMFRRRGAGTFQF